MVPRLAQALGRAGDGMTATYATRAEAVSALVVEPIAAGAVEDVAAEYDLAAIADEVLEWEDAYDAATNTYHLNNQGWRYAPAFDHLHPDYAGDDAFWSVVASRERVTA